MANKRVTSRGDGAAKNRHGAGLYEEVKRGIAAAGRINPGRDASAENLARVKRAGSGPWVAGTRDDLNVANSGKPKHNI